MKHPWDATAQLWPWAAHCGSCWHLPLPSTAWLVCHHVRAFGKQLLLMFPVVVQDTRLHNQPLEICIVCIIWATLLSVPVFAFKTPLP